MGKVVLTCGSYDLFHIGHLNFLKKAKSLGDYLIVGVSSKKCNSEKNKSSYIDLEQRLELIKSCKYVDEVFVEDSLTFKQYYITKYKADVFAIGDDWKGKFDFLTCEVIYLPRTQNISTTCIKQNLKYDFFFVDMYHNFHKYMDNILSHFLTNIRINPDLITLTSLLIFIPICYTSNNFLIGLLFLIHDLLDRCDGVMARLYEKNNIICDKKFGAYLDALCDKIFVFLIGVFLINNWLLNIKMLIHIISISKRTHTYLGDSQINKNKSTISGKMSTFLENIGFASYYWFPNYFSLIMFSSITMQIQSLYEKFKF